MLAIVFRCPIVFLNPMFGWRGDEGRVERRGGEDGWNILIFSIFH
jgi:hypothetical protein